MADSRVQGHFQQNSDLGQDNSGSSQRQGPEVYKFSPDELRVIKQCNVESFYQRCLPIGSFLGLGTYYAVKAGYLRGHAKFGATPKTTLAVIAGYFIGKLSYQQKCAEKIMALPNSRMGEMLRQRRRQGIESISLEPGFSAPLGLDTSIGPTATDSGTRPSYLDMDSDRRYIGDFDRPPVQDETYDLSAIPVPPGGAPATSYDDLRRKNREDYEAQRNKPYSSRPISDLPEASPPVDRRPVSEMPRKPKNKYGDEWE